MGFVQEENYFHNTKMKIMEEKINLFFKHINVSDYSHSKIG